MDRLTFSTASSAIEERFASYHDLYAPVADVVQLGDNFAAEVQAHRLGDLILFERQPVSVRHVRSPLRVARNGFDHFTLQVALQGTFRVATAAGQAALACGSLVVIDMRQPMATDAVDARILTLSVPRALVETVASGTDQLHGVVLSPARGALLRDFLLSVLQHGGAESLRAPGRIGRVVTELLTLALEDRGASGRDGLQDALDAACRQQARRFIDANLTAEPEAVARAVGRSRSALYRAFEPHGGVGRYIQSRRLARLRACLADPRDCRTVAQLAHLCGFGSDSHCNRSFKAAYGLTPSDFRAVRHRPDLSRASGADGVGLLERWWSDLR